MKLRNLIVFLSLLTLPLYAEEVLSRTQHSANINGTAIPYLATAGNYEIKDEEGKVGASIFFIAYTKENVTDLSTRPITFCFNGGPGSSSVWLHLGAFGPLRVAMDEEGIPLQPVRLENNGFSLLDVTDLVFIDPVSTGYSEAIPATEAKKFHTVEEDLKSVREFIRLYVTRNDRWLSPKFIAGESYGTTRAAALAYQLFEQNRMTIQGLILVSSILSFQPYMANTGNELPYVMFLPAYAAVAWQHKRLNSKDDLPTILQHAERFALGDYATALLQGSKMDPSEKQLVVDKMSELTGLSNEFLLKHNLRVDVCYFTKELLKDKKRIISRFDGRFTGVDPTPELACNNIDPLYAILFPAFTSAFNHYMRDQLKVEKDAKYEVLKELNWKFDSAENQYLDVTDELRRAMSKNPEMRVYIASGLFDLATPYFAGQYVLNHLNLDPSLQGNIQNSYFDAGHMMFIDKSSLIKLKKELSAFYKSSLTSRSNASVK